MDKYPKYISQEQQEIFEQFLRGKMSEEEHSSFEFSLSKDEKLKNSFKEFKSLFEAVEEDGLRSKLEDFHKAMEEETPVRQINTSKKWFTYSIAASISIFLAVGGLWFFNRQSPNEALFEQYFSPDPGLPTVMGTNDNFAFYEAMVDYKLGNYEIAIKKWEKLLETKPENDTLNYFLGSAYLANMEFETALDYLLKNEHNESSPFYEETHFYLGMTYLKLNKVSKVKTHFEKSKVPVSNEILEAIEDK